MLLLFIYAAEDGEMCHRLFLFLASKRSGFLSEPGLAIRALKMQAQMRAERMGETRKEWASEG